MTLQSQPRFGGGVPGRRYSEVSKDGGTRMRNAAIGAGIGGAAAYQGTGLAMAAGLHEVAGKPAGRPFMDSLKPTMRHWNNPSSMAHAFRTGALSGKGMGKLVGGGAAIGAGLGALRGGKKQPQIAPTYNNFASPMAKADWRNISEHQTQAARGRRRRNVGVGLAATGAGLVGAGGGQGLREAGAIIEGHRRAHQYVSNHNQMFGKVPGAKVGLGQRLKAHAQGHVKSIGTHPHGHITGTGLGLLATGGGLALSGSMKQRRHEGAITRQRRQRAASTTVGKGWGADVALRTAGKQRALADAMTPARRPGIPMDMLRHASKPGPPRTKMSPEDREALQRKMDNPFNAAARGQWRAGVRPFGKARAFDSESSRQRHLGAGEAVTGLGGAGSLAFGVRGIRNTTRQVRLTPTAYTERDLSPEGKKKAAAAGHSNPRGKHIRVNDMHVARNLLAGKKRDVLLAAGGLAGLGAAGAIHHHANSPRGRTWY